MKNKALLSYLFGAVSAAVTVCMSLFLRNTIKSPALYLISLLCGIITGLVGFLVTAAPFSGEKKSLGHDAKIIITTLFSLIAANLVYSLFASSDTGADIEITFSGIFSAVLIIPLAEELFFRKILPSLLLFREGTGSLVLSAVISSAIFAYFHSSYRVYAFIAGVILCLASYFAKKPLVSCFIAHAAYNGLLVLDSVLKAETDIPGFVVPASSLVLLAAAFFLIFIFERKNTDEM